VLARVQDTSRDVKTLGGAASSAPAGAHRNVSRSSGPIGDQAASV